MAVLARTTLRRYGRRYPSRRRISRPSYAFPRTSSSCIAIVSGCLELVLEQLAAMKGGVEAVDTNEIRVATALGDTAVVQDDDFVGVLHRRDAVRHDDRRALTHHLRQSMQDLFFGVGIHRREGIVQNED